MTCRKVFVPFVLIWISVRASYEALQQPYFQPTALYNYAWEVDDQASYNYYRQRESRNGDETDGFYQVRLPDGRLQTVKYRVYKNSGFMADISYEGEKDPYNYQRQSIYSPLYSPDYATILFPQPDPVKLRASDTDGRYYPAQPQSLSYETSYDRNGQHQDISYLLLPLSRPVSPETYSRKLTSSTPAATLHSPRIDSFQSAQTESQPRARPTTTTPHSVPEPATTAESAVPEPTENSVSNSRDTSIVTTNENGKTAKNTEKQKEVNHRSYDNPLYRIDFYTARAKSGLSTPIPYEEVRSTDDVKYIKPSATYSVPEELGSYPVIHRKATARKPASTDYEVPRAAKENVF